VFLGAHIFIWLLGCGVLCGMVEDTRGRGFGLELQVQSEKMKRWVKILPIISPMWTQSFPYNRAVPP